MDRNLDYDPLAALSVRIATPVEQDFLKENIHHIEAEHGTEIAADIVRALSYDDFEAAGRVAGMLCAEADFSMVSEGSPACVEWVAGDASGSTEMPSGTPAQAMLIAAINARRATASNTPGGPRS